MVEHQSHYLLINRMLHFILGLSTKSGSESHGTTLRPPQAKLPSCQRKPASRIGLSADVFQTLDSGFRRNDDVIRVFFLKVVT